MFSALAMPDVYHAHTAIRYHGARRMLFSLKCTFFATPPHQGVYDVRRLLRVFAVPGAPAAASHAAGIRCLTTVDTSLCR
jgi:hypothetical protein